jgi:hypothetical protein
MEASIAFPCMTGASSSQPEILFYQRVTRYYPLQLHPCCLTKFFVIVTTISVAVIPALLRPPHLGFILLLLSLLFSFLVSI